MWLQSKLSSCHGRGSGVVGLDASTRDDIVTAFVKGVCHQELELSNLSKDKVNNVLGS